MADGRLDEVDAAAALLQAAGKGDVRTDQALELETLAQQCDAVAIGTADLDGSAAAALSLLLGQQQVALPSEVGLNGGVEGPRNPQSALVVALVEGLSAEVRVKSVPLQHRERHGVFRRAVQRRPVIRSSRRSPNSASR